MGAKHMVEFGLYKIKGAINVQLAEKTGFTEEDADKIKECLRTLFINDSSSARPDGSMEVVRLYWWRHNNKIGQYSSAKVHQSVQITPKAGVTYPKSAAGYDIALASAPAFIFRFSTGRFYSKRTIFSTRAARAGRPWTTSMRCCRFPTAC